MLIATTIKSCREPLPWPSCVLAGILITSSVLQSVLSRTLENIYASNEWADIKMNLIVATDCTNEGNKDCHFSHHVSGDVA